MQNFLNYSKVIGLAISLFLLVGCNKKAIISENTMAHIISEMYLADQYVEQSPNMRALSDTLKIYPAITAKYGFTPDEYINSTRYYLQKGTKYKKIHVIARDLLAQKEALLKKEMGVKSRTLDSIKWWAIDSINSTSFRDLKYDSYLRVVYSFLPKNLFRSNWTILDSAYTDIIDNYNWWQANLVPYQRSFTSFAFAQEDKKDAEKISKITVPSKEIPQKEKRVRKDELVSDPKVKKLNDKDIPQKLEEIK